MKRRSIREIAVQSLYHMEMNEVQADEAVTMLLLEAAGDNEGDMSAILDPQAAKGLILELINGVNEHKTSIDGILEQYLKGWQMSRLSRVDRQILRLASYEMIFRDDVPAKVAVNEAIELSKHFGTDESGKFVNGVLGKMITDLDQLKN